MKKKKNSEPDKETSSELTEGLRNYLYFTAASTGACILIVEILGAKMLSPFLGTSHFVWTAQIAVTLVALSAGYYAGGWLVDRSPKLNQLYYGILGAAVYLAATVPLVKSICFKLMALPLAWATLLASMFLFLVPLALLAMTGPFLVRLLTQSVSQVGLNVGRLSAISTLGSVTGTVLIGYVLVPRFPNSVTMLITSGILIALAAVYLIVWGRGTGSNALMVAIGLSVVFGFSGMRGQFENTMNYGGTNWSVLYRANSNYGELQVIEYSYGGATERRYLNDQLVQNTYDPDTGQSRSLFTGALRWLAHAYTPRIDRALCIGMGVGVVPMQFARDGIVTDVVEINGAVVPMAEEFFGFDANLEKLTVEVGDGRQFLNQTDTRYDAIILDAFLGDSSPSHLMTREAFGEMRDALSDHGVLVINSFGESNPDRQFFSASLDKTLRTVFSPECVRVHASGQGNVFFVATRDKALMAHRPPAAPSDEARQRFASAGDDFDIKREWNDWLVAANFKGPFFSEHSVVQGQMGLMWRKTRTFDQAQGRVLVDDFNPVEFHDARNREENRRWLIKQLSPDDG